MTTVVETESGDAIKEKLTALVSTYFNTDKGMLAGFREEQVKTTPQVDGLVNPVYSKGYVFVDGNKVGDMSYEPIMHSIKEDFKEGGRAITRYFVDHISDIAGFSWEKD